MKALELVCWLIDLAPTGFAAFQPNVQIEASDLEVNRRESEYGEYEDIVFEDGRLIACTPRRVWA